MTDNQDDGFLKPGTLLDFQKAYPSLGSIPAHPIPEFTAFTLFGLRNEFKNMVGPVFRDATVFLGYEVCLAIIQEPSWAQVFDPSVGQGSILSGLMGSALGMEIWTDAYCHPLDKFISRDEIWLTAVVGNQRASLKAQLTSVKKEQS